jgi:molybdopterin molybdotransferase
MVAHSDKLQRIARLTPLGEVLPLMEGLARPVAVQEVDLPGAFGLTLAEDVVARSARPPAALAIRDGWAVTSGDILDAAATAPVPLPQPPAWLETGDPLPPGTDAVAPFDAIAWHGGAAEAVAPIAPGEGALAAGADTGAGAVLRPAGVRLRNSDLAVLAAAGIEGASVRVPRIRVVHAGPANPVSEAAIALVVRVIATEGGEVLQQAGATADDLDRAFRHPGADAVIGIGGTGMGRRDAGVRTLARSGRVAVHGVAISPGETAALGEVEGRPVLLLPGRIDAALAAWLLLGRPLLARLSGGSNAADGIECTLSRKASSSLGLAEVIPVRRVGDKAEPLASGYLSLAALANADGWILVPPDSEGYPAGTRVAVRLLP